MPLGPDSTGTAFGALLQAPSTASMRRGRNSPAAMTDRPYLRGGFLPLPGGGPIFTWRELNHTQMPPLEDWELTMGDVELF